jgi:adenosylcobinamide-phosphate synthase
MAAMALGLGVCLHKPDVYALNATGRAPGRADTELALIYATKVALALVLSAGVALIFIVTGWSSWT